MSKNALSLIALHSSSLPPRSWLSSRSKTNPGGRGRRSLRRVLHSAPATFIAAHFKSFLAGDPNLDIVAFFQLKRLDDCGRQSNRPGCCPTSKPAQAPPWIYILIAYLMPSPSKRRARRFSMCKSGEAYRLNPFIRQCLRGSLPVQNKGRISMKTLHLIRQDKPVYLTRQRTRNG